MSKKRGTWEWYLKTGERLMKVSEKQVLIHVSTVMGTLYLVCGQ